MAVFAPTYLRPLVTSWLGAALLAAGLLLVGCAAAAFWLLDHLDVHPARRPLLSLPILVVFLFPALWIVIMGPAIVVFATRR